MENGQMNKKEKAKEKLQEAQHDTHFHRHRNAKKIQNWKLKSQSISKRPIGVLLSHHSGCLL